MEEDITLQLELEAEWREKDYFAKLERAYHDEVLPKVRQELKEWAEEFPLDYRVTCRKEYIQDEIDFTKLVFFTVCRQLARSKTPPFGFVERAAALEKKLHRLGMEAKIAAGKLDGVSPERIAKARQYPLSNLVKTTRGMALCVFHRERSPSMDVRKGFYYCYGCGATGDAIDLAMKLQNLTFKEAVEYLQ